MQFTVQQVWNLEQARCRFGKYLRVAVALDTDARAPDVAKLVKEFPPVNEASEQGNLVRGLGIRLHLQRTLGSSPGPDVDTCVGAEAVLALGEEARFFPSDSALASWRAQAYQGRAVVAYE
jgi:DNA polymerase-3 subunit alpha